jgi:hypothetical protein
MENIGQSCRAVRGVESNSDVPKVVAKIQMGPNARHPARVKAARIAMAPVGATWGRVVATGAWTVD